MLGLEEIGNAGNGKPSNSGGNAPEECKTASPRKYLLPQPKNAHLALECTASKQSAITKSAGREWEILSLFGLFWIAGAYLPRQTLDCGKIRRVATEEEGTADSTQASKAGIWERTTREDQPRNRLAAYHS
jgi:hypothetical protein